VTPLPEPTATRPRFPAGYGISAKRDGLLPWSWAAERLAAATNYWVATTAADGSPHTLPVWGLWLDDGFHFGTDAQTQTGRNLARDPRVAVHLESADEVVLVKGVAERWQVDDRAADASHAKYGHRPEPGSDEWRVQPQVAFAWVVAELGRSATKFVF
jgi:hypothetical protein